MEEFALITGASSGIGLAYARQLAAQGWNILVVSNRADDNISVTEELKGRFGVEAIPVYADLTEQSAVARLYDQIKRKGIRVGMVVSNAGLLQFSRLIHTDMTMINRVVSLHCMVPTELCRLFIPDMIARGRGYVVLMSSVTAWMSYPTISVYAASKTYLRSFGRSLWYELRESGVHITTVFPSAVDTPFYALETRLRRRLLRFGVMQSAESVASKAIHAVFKGRCFCYPGPYTRIEAMICSVLPAWIMSCVMKIPRVRRLVNRL